MLNSRQPLSFWIQVLLRSALQIAIGYFVFGIYPVMSMLLLGEGGGSLLYSTGNHIAWAISPLVIPFFWNAQEIYGAHNTPKNRKMYQVVFLIFIGAYLIFTTIWGVSRGFKI